MKYFITLLAVCAFLSPLASFAAGNWTQAATVSSINQQPAKPPFPERVYFSSAESTISTCGQSGLYYLSAEGKHMDRLFSMLLTAYSTGKNVKLYSEGSCDPWNATKVEGIILE